MTGNQSIQFIGRCLTLGKFPERGALILNEIAAKDFSWEQIVYNASNQYVLTAWYLQMKNAGLLETMPKELIDHIAEMTHLNRERNRKIAAQVTEIAALLHNHGITPVFLKGAAHLMLGLYNDPAERLIGDIDFLVSDHEVLPAAELFAKLGFDPISSYQAELHGKMKHYPRMVNADYPAAIEIHREVIVPPYDRLLKAHQILHEKQATPKNNSVFVPSNQHLILHNTLNSQINDKGFSNASILFRQRYDFLLLSEREKPGPILENLYSYRKGSIAWLSTSNLLLGGVPNLTIPIQEQPKIYLAWFSWMQNHHKMAAVYRSLRYVSDRIWSYFTLLMMTLIDQDTRSALRRRLSERGWLKRHISSYKEHFRPNFG